MNRTLRSQLPPNPRDLAVFDTTTGSSPGRTRGSSLFQRGLILFSMLFALVLGVNAQGTFTVPTTSAGTTNNTTGGITPFTTASEDGKSQYLYTAAELTAAGLTAGPIHQFGFDWSSAGGQPAQNVNLKMGHIAAGTTNISSFQTPSWTDVWSSPSVTPTVSATAGSGYNLWTLTTPFTWDGTSNIIVQVCFNNSSSSTNWGVRTTQLTSGVSRSVGAFANSADGCALTTTSFISSNTRRNRPNARFVRFPECTGTPNTPAATTTISTPICAQPFTLTATGMSAGVGGISNQWQVSNTSGGPYTNVTGGSGGTTGSYTSATLSGGNYYYVLSSTCATSTVLSNEILIQILETPTVPVLTAATAPSFSGFTANWSAAAGATSYIIDVSTSPTFASTLLSYTGVNVGNVTSYSITGLAANVRHYYRIRATNGTCESLNSVAQDFLTGYCAPVTTYGCADGDVIARVILNTLDNNSGTGCPSDPNPTDASGTANVQGPGYSDYTSNSELTTTLLPSTSYNCTVYAGQYSEGYAAWIDYNDNFIFETSERIGFSAGQVTGSGQAGVLGSSATFPITISCTPPSGVHRLRVRAMYNTIGSLVDPCANNSYGEIEDYLITIQAPPACASAGPLSNTGLTSTSASFSWTLGCATGTNYDFEYGPAGFTPGTGTLLTNQTATIAAGSGSYTLTGLTPGTSYDVYSRVNCGSSVSLWSPVVNVFTGPSSTSPLFWLTNVTTTGGLTNFNNTTTLSANGYGDYTATHSVSEFPGSTFDLSASYNETGYQNFAKIWVDWNNDQDFDDAGETMYTSATGVAAIPFTAPLTVPVGQAPGNYRMRVRFSLDTPAISTGTLAPFGPITWGEGEDYTLTVTPLPPAPTVDLIDPLEACPGSTIAVTGTEFIGVSAVNFVNIEFGTSTPAASFSVTSSTQMSVAMPQGLPGGAYSLSVTNITGTGGGLFIAKPGATTTISGNLGICGTTPATLNASGTGTFEWTAASTSTYSIRLNDTYGDGWNGGSVNVVVDGTTVVTGGSIASGFGPVYYDFSVSPGSNVVINYTGGSYVYENNYTVFSGSNGSGTQLFASTVGSAPPTSQTITVSQMGTATMTSAGSSSSVTSSTAGWYTVTFTDGTTGCQATASTSIQSRPVPVITAPAQVSACIGGNATITASSDIPVVSYTWTSLSSAVSTNTANGTFTVGPMSADDLYSIVGSTEYCPSIPAFSGIAVTGLSGVVLTPSNITCNGAGNGSFALASFDCGAAPFTYSVVATGAAVGTFGPIPTNLAAGTYDVYVTDADGNFTNSPIAITITEPALITAVTTTTNGIACSGETTGNVSATALVTGTVSVSSGPLTSAITSNNPATTSVLSVAGIPAGATLTGISVNFDITHTYDGDLSLSLIGPGGVSVDLSSGNGGGGEDYSNTTISSSSSNPVTGGSAPFTGTFAPEGNLSALYSNTNGNWTFSALDDVGGDNGTLLGWSLTLNYSYPSTADVKWYSDAAATNVIGTGGTLNVVGTSVCPSPAASGVYTVYAAYTQGVCVGPISSATLTVSGLSGVVLTPINLTCFGSNNGSFSQTEACGTAPFTYSVVATGASAGAYAALPTNLSAGTYDVYVQDNGSNSAGPFAITITQPDALPSTVTTDGAACENATEGNVSAISEATNSQITTLNSGVVSLPGATLDFDTFEYIPSNTAITATIPALPAGATINSVNLVVNGLTTNNGTWDTEIKVEVSGAAVLPEQVLGTANTVVTNAGPYTKVLSGLNPAGGNVTVTFYNTYSGAATINSVQLVVNYSEPVPVAWFADAAGLTQIGTGNTLNVIGTSVCPAGAAGSYTVYAAASDGACFGVLAPATLVVGAPLTAAVNPVILGNPNINVIANYTLPDFSYIPLTQTISVPAGATITSASLELTNVVSGDAFLYDSDISVGVTGAATLATLFLGNTDVPLVGDNFSFPLTVNPTGSSVTVTLSNIGFSAVTFGNVFLNVNYTLPATGAICPGATLNLVAVATGGGSTKNYTWFNNSAQVATGSSFNATMNTGDSYTVEVTDECGSAVTSVAYVPTFESLSGGTISGTTSIMVNDVTATNPGVGSYTLTGETAGNTISWLYSSASATGPWVTVGGSLNTQNLNFTGLNGTYYVASQITSAGGCTAISNALTVSVGVLNDNACDAIALTTGNQGGYAYTMQGSTAQAGEIAGGFSGASTNSIWFKFTAPASGRVSIESNDALGTDNFMRLYSATDCSNLSTFTSLFTNDESGNGSNAFIQNATCLTPGQVYYVQLSPWSGVADDAVYTITLTDLGNTAPVITNVPANISRNAATGTCARTATWTAPTATDDQPNCLVVTSTHNSGASFPVGVTTVTYTATDGQGLVTTASFTVTVNDTQLPTVTAPAAVTVTAALNSCTATATLGTAISADNCGVATTINDAPATFPIGNTTVTYTVTDVNGNVATATQVVTVNVNPANIWYVDADGDNYGVAGATVTSCSQPTGYAANTTDCDDSNANVNPGEIEICGNVIDDNCSGTSEEGCLDPGENPSNAITMTTTNWPNCSSINGTLVNATATGAAQTVCLTGEDKWHQFVATSEGISIVVNSTSADILIELQNASGDLIAQENAVSGIGGETLNHSGLVSGQVYKVGIRNYNSALGTGTYTVCAKMLKRGGCDYGPGPYSLCQFFKGTWAGAAGTSYTFTFTGLTGPATGNVYTRTQSNNICVLSSVLPTLPYGSTYSVLVTNVYSLQNASGQTEVISVPALSACSMNTAAQPSTALRTADQCAAGPRFRGSIVASMPWVCGAINWRWEFTELDASGEPMGLPIVLNRGAGSNFINLGLISQLHYGKTYSVRTAPIMSYTGENYQWGASVCMSIVGSAGMIADGGQANNQTMRMETANEFNMSLYPNPTHGTDVNINLSGVDSENVQIRIVDAMGRQVWNNRYSVNGILNTNITFERPLANGLYFVEAIFNGEVQTQRMMVQK